jgi:hypothetical protein
MNLITKEVILGSAILGGIIGTAIILRSNQANAGAIPTQPQPISTPKVVTVTEANSGQTINLNIGDTLLIVLQITNTIAGYAIADLGKGIMTAGVQTTLANQTTQPWIPVQRGTDTITCVPVNNNAPPITYNIAVS